MESSNLNPLLLQQIQANLGSNTDLPPNLVQMLQAVSDSYTKFELDLKTAESTIASRTDQLIASTSRAYSFLDSINKGFIMCDTTGEVVLANDSLRKIVSTKVQTQPDAHLTVDLLNDYFSPDLELKKMIETCLATSQPTEKDDISFGKFILHLYLAPLLNQSGTGGQELLGVVMLVEDVTEKKVLERSKDEFLSIASHELRTPLTAIRGNAALIKKYYSGDIKNKDMAEMVDDIHESSIRLIDIVNDFLDVAAIEQGKINMQPANFSLKEVITEVVHELGNLCKEKGIDLVADPSVQSTPDVYADRQRIKQVIINLVGNSKKFTDKGSITISTSLNNGFVQTTITDTGRGMSEENQKLLFRKFQQAGSSLLTRDTTKGTGLGLYISKLIVELSGGKIGLLSSKVDVGSSFGFTLPRAK